MRRFRSLALSSVIVLTVAMIGAQDPQKQEQKPGGRDPDLVVADQAVRVQPMDPDEKGHWIVMPAHADLGSPCFSRDGEWIAFDAYREGYNNRHPEAWIARRDGTGLKKLTNGATPRWSPDGSRLLFVRSSEVVPNEDFDIYLINPDGNNEQKLGRGAGRTGLRTARELYIRGADCPAAAPGSEPRSSFAMPTVNMTPSSPTAIARAGRPAAARSPFASGSRAVLVKSTSST